MSRRQADDSPQPDDRQTIGTDGRHHSRHMGEAGEGTEGEGEGERGTDCGWRAVLAELWAIDWDYCRACLCAYFGLQSETIIQSPLDCLCTL